MNRYRYQRPRPAPVPRPNKDTACPICGEDTVLWPYLVDGTEINACADCGPKVQGAERAVGERTPAQ